MSLFNLYNSQDTSAQSNDLGYIPWGEYETRYARPEVTYSEGSMYPDYNWVEAQNKWETDRYNYYNDQFFNKNPFKIGDPGTTTLYWGQNTGSLNNQNPFKVSTNPFEGGKAFAVSDPAAAGFNMPTEGWDRFWNQAFGSTIQEEYVPTWFSGAQGKDTTNFDYMTGINPFKENWGFDKASLMQKPDDGGFLGMLKEMAPALAIMAAPFGMGALQSIFPSLAGGTASLGAIDSALLSGAGAAGTAANAAPAVGNAAMVAGGGGGSVSVPAVEGGLATLPEAGTWANTAAPALGTSAGEWTLPPALASEGSLAGIPGAMQALPDIYGPPIDLANPGINPLAEFAGPAADLAGTGSGGGDLLDIVTEAVKKMGSSAMDKFTKDPVGTLGTLVTGILDNQRARSNEKANSAQQERYEAGADPFGPERDYYQELLRQSYDNPYALKDSPEYGGLGRIYQDQIARRDAAKGRTVAGVLPRDIEMQDHFMKWLNDYRSGLQQAAGSNINPNGVYSSFLDNQRANQAAQSNAYGGIPYALGKIFDPYANEKQSFTEDVMRFLKELV